LSLLRSIGLTFAGAGIGSILRLNCVQTEPVLKIDGKQQQTLHFDAPHAILTILDQTRLPFTVAWLHLTEHQQVCHAISSMQVRGAPAIGATAAFGMVLAVRQKLPLSVAAAALKATRPTAVNLAWAVDRMLARLNVDPTYAAAFAEAEAIRAEDVAACSALGDTGVAIIDEISRRKNGKPVNILTHCNAGWLCAVDWGTALAPIYKAQAKGIAVHVWVDETRPRNQGASLTTFELKEQGIPHTLICDNSGGHLMQHGQVDMCIVGSDRTTANGDVCNKIGTYLKALAAFDNGIPFYAALPTSTVDWQLASGAEIPIEERSGLEVLEMTGRTKLGLLETIQIAGPGIVAANPAFDVTPARLVTGLITERGVFPATPAGLASLRKQLSHG
jgi:methylthioribose-1-phosphate isomerase